MMDVVQAALDYGFSYAGRMDPQRLEVRREVRLMCSANRCQAYDTCWVCPPAIGSLDNSRQTLAAYRSGLLVQTTGALEDPFDYEAMMELDRLQKERLSDFREDLWPHFPDLIALGNGPCAICEQCTYPEAPCRHPHLAVQSMEAFGLVVSDVCELGGLGYYYGPNTMTFTGCYLLERQDAITSTICR